MVEDMYVGLRNPIIVFCDVTDCGSLFYAMGEFIAKSRLPMAFLGRTEKKEKDPDLALATVRTLFSYCAKLQMSYLGLNVPLTARAILGQVHSICQL